MLLESIITLLLACAIGGFLAAWNQAPLPLGYILGGVVVGPYGLGLISHVLEVQTLAQIGTIFLMFQHGIEYPVDYRAFRSSHVYSGLFIMAIQWIFCAAFGLYSHYIPFLSEGVMYGAAMCAR